MPQGAERLLQGRTIDQLTPPSFTAPTPSSDILVATPHDSAGSPIAAPSPTMQLVQKKKAMDGAILFVQGRYDEMIRNLDSDEKVIMSHWLYQYWFYAFKTAKAWGRGPRSWTADMLRFDKYMPKGDAILPGTPNQAGSGRSLMMSESPEPSDLCLWSIHVPATSMPDYEPIEEEPLVDQSMIPPNPDDESEWKIWPQNWFQPPLQEQFRDALEHNDFSTISTDNLPVAVPQLLRVTQRNPDELIEETLSFAIMARNFEGVYETLKDLRRANLDVSSLYPYHLATTYLDGHKSCCKVLTELRSAGVKPNPYTNEIGHTVVDNLMIAIIRSHTSLEPAGMDDAFRNQVRFPGEEVDICGRWDADSDCIRSLLMNDNTSIPFSWKHKFCHTSIQTICHSIAVVCTVLPVGRRSESGLFRRQCFRCGVKLELGPIHTLVMTAFHLATRGCEDEDLFGMIACLLCLVRQDFDVQRQATISVVALLEGRDLVDEDLCCHLDVNPAGLTDALQEKTNITVWPKKVRIGWDLFRATLLRCAQAADARDLEDWNQLNLDDHFVGSPSDILVESHMEYHTIDSLPFGLDKDLASLWAAIQAEFLTYRRLHHDDNWTSEYLDMERLHESFVQEGRIRLRMIEDNILKPHCVCGEFECRYDGRATLNDVTNQYIANLDVWSRATYLELEEDEV